MAQGRYRWHVVSSLVELLGLSIWIGGLVVIIMAVIPAVFNSVGMEVGGRFLRRVFDGYNTLTSAVLLILISTIAIRMWGMLRAKLALFPVSRMEIGLLGMMIVVTILITLVLGPKAIHLQEQAFAANGEGAKKMAYDEFFRLHMIIRSLHLLNLGLGVGLLTVKVRQWIGVNGQLSQGKDPLS